MIYVDDHLRTKLTLNQKFKDIVETKRKMEGKETLRTKSKHGPKFRGRSCFDQLFNFNKSIESTTVLPSQSRDTLVGRR